MNIVGIYKITNKINNHCYIGQSRNIKKRWQDHKIASNNQNDKSYNYPLYRAFRKYGIKNFDFEIIEQCNLNELNEKEKKWINFYKAQYNQTIEQFHTIPQKLTLQQVKEIQQILISDTEGNISHKELGEKYGVSGKDTIRDINVGRTWYDPTLNYPLHYSKYDANKPSSLKEKYFCPDCGKRVTKQGCRCIQCSHKTRYKIQHPDRETLKNLIRTMPFVAIGKKYGVSDNAIRKWCDKYNLPRKVSEIKKYSDKEWEKI